MADKWVDNNAYLGPDRRRNGGSRLLRERRHGNDAGDPPPLGALLRRARVALLSMTTREDRDRTVKLVRAAIEIAERRQQRECAAKLRDALRAISAAEPKNNEAIARADTVLQQAIMLV